MADDEFDLLTVNKGLVVAPAGCGKTELILQAVSRHSPPKPILVLTHTNAGVSALRSRLNKARVSTAKYRLATIDGWAIKLINTFPSSSGHDPAIVTRERPDYPAIREAAYKLIQAGHVNDVISASYARLFVDEHQDCSLRQHAIVYFLAPIIPTCIVGDQMQSIFNFDQNDPLVDWDKYVRAHFPEVHALSKPWRWINAECEQLGAWLLDVRSKLLAKIPIDLRTAPEHVQWVRLDGSANDYPKQLQAGRVEAPGNNGSVLILGNSKNPRSQRAFASQTPGAVTIEAVDLRDLVSFARDFNINAADGLQQIASFAENVMTNVGAADLVSRVSSLTRGTARKEASSVEQAAIAFQNNRTYANVANLLAAIDMDAGVRAHRPLVLQSCYRALEMCATPGKTFLEAATQIREQNRFIGRAIPRRSVGSTLLLKGLEADVAVVLDADALDARNLYVALTRGAKRLVVCSRDRTLSPTW